MTNRKCKRYEIKINEEIYFTTSYRISSALTRCQIKYLRKHGSGIFNINKKKDECELFINVKKVKEVKKLKQKR